MPCMDQEGECTIGNWCVCQWTFAKYIKLAGGCDAIVDLVCDATNLAALKAYREQPATDADVKAALACVEAKCNIPQTAGFFMPSVPTFDSLPERSFLAPAVIATVGTALIFFLSTLRRV